GTVWALERYGVEPDLLVSGKSLGGGLPLAAVTGRAEFMDAVAPGGLGGTFSGNPLACAAACVVLDEVARPEFRARAEDVAARLQRSGSSASAARTATSMRSRASTSTSRRASSSPCSGRPAPARRRRCG